MKQVIPFKKNSSKKTFFKAIYRHLGFVVIQFGLLVVSVDLFMNMFAFLCEIDNPWIQ